VSSRPNGREVLYVFGTLSGLSLRSRWLTALNNNSIYLTRIEDSRDSFFDIPNYLKHHRCGSCDKELMTRVFVGYFQNFVNFIFFIVQKLYILLKLNFDPAR